jgi:CHAD domain-containing protein
MLKTYHYAVPRQSGSDALTGLLRDAGFLFLRNPGPALDRSYYDSFDWRLYADGLLLFVDNHGARMRMCLRECATGLDLVCVDVTDVPRFAGDLPRGLIHERVAPLLKERRLLEMVALKSRREEFRVLDGEQKTVMRASVESHRVKTGERSVRLLDRMELMPVRGFHEPLRILLSLLESSDDIRELPVNVFEEALHAVDRQPLDYRSRPRLRLQPGQSVGTAARAIFACLLDVVEANEDGVRQDLDSGFLHDMRVAVRRSRTVLGEMKRILSAPHFVHYREELAWLAAVTGPVRDLDVLLEALSEYGEWLGAEHRRGLDALRAVVRSRRSVERRALLEALASQRYRALKKGWRALIEADDARWGADAAARPAGEAALAMIERRRDKLIAHGEKLAADSPDEDFHDLRKQVKKLRYLLELFAGAIPAGSARALLHGLKELQKRLGTYQDMSVHRAALKGLRESLTAEDGQDEAAQQALSLLLDEMRARKRDAAGELIRAFSRFAGAAKKKRFRTRSGERHQELVQ